MGFIQWTGPSALFSLPITRLMYHIWRFVDASPLPQETKDRISSNGRGPLNSNDRVIARWPEESLAYELPDPLGIEVSTCIFLSTFAQSYVNIQEDAKGYLTSCNEGDVRVVFILVINEDPEWTSNERECLPKENLHDLRKGMTNDLSGVRFQITGDDFCWVNKISNAFVEVWQLNSSGQAQLTAKQVSWCFSIFPLC